MSDIVADKFENYELIDTSFGKKIEKIDGLIVERPCPQAIWSRRKGQDVWNSADARCVRRKDGGGAWEDKHNKLKDGIFNWTSPLTEKKFKFKINYTNFGHCGIFFEQIAIWNLVEKQIERIKKNKKTQLTFLNLFAYTGAASVIAAANGCSVDHVDSAKSILDWAGENIKTNGQHKIQMKLIHEDAMKYVKKLKSEGKKFDGILADPPSWGHGAKKEMWDFDKNISQLVEACSEILSDSDSFFILTTHTHGVQKEAIKNLMKSCNYKSEVVCGDIGIRHHDDERILPAGIYVCSTK